MKKTLIALAISTMASMTANATVIYEKDGSKLDLDGRMHFELRNDSASRNDLRDIGSRVRVRAYQDIGAGINVFGGVELRFSKSNGSSDDIGNNLRTHRLFVGVSQKDIGTLTFGRQLHLGDHIPKANYTYDGGGNIFFDGHKKAATFMSVPFYGVRFAADYYFGNANKAGNNSSSNSGGEATTPKPTAWDEGQGYGVGLFYDETLGDLKVRVGAGYSEVTQSDTGLKKDEFKLKRGGIGFDVKYDIVTFGIDYAFARVSNSEKESNNIGFQKVAGYNTELNKNDRFLVGVKVDVTKENSVYGEYYFAKAKKADKTADSIKMQGWMLGVDHRINKNLVVYLEGGKGKVTQTNIVLNKDGKANHRLALGVRMLF